MEQALAVLAPYLDPLQVLLLALAVRELRALRSQVVKLQKAREDHGTRLTVLETRAGIA